MSRVSSVSRVWISAGCFALTALSGEGYVHGARLPIPIPSHQVRQSASSATATSEPPALVKRYCVSCHSGPSPRGGLSLDRLDIDKVGQSPEVWEKVVRKLRAGVMPP